MRREEFFEVLGELDDDIVKGAEIPVKKKLNWKLWGTMAACLAVIAALGIGFHNGIFGSSTDIAALDNGNEIIFVKSNTANSSLDIAANIYTRHLTEEEAHSLFAGLPVTADAIYMKSSADAGESQELIGFEGRIGNVKMVVSTSDIQLLDTVIVGKEKSTEVNGTSVTAGYFVTDPNSRGERNAIYYAAFELGDCKIYLENSGAVENSEATKNQLAELIQKLTESGEPDLSSLADGKVGTGVDGDPDGYAPPADNQTSDEEVIEQDDQTINKG